ncbi:hypothetical protein PPSIR1_40849 [Plesiocystis pacifica SIR-1]|uniref:DUF4336 domain-containing protein n=1 Tax=Plesiocystis pacifica SIR-1 TaxID=391625 RepID=A6GHE7_9BACT|nr:hypothetical protein [Plesiocystis pacifica]EDM74711.1 hypothetical protein PPSIR1_40849 [Plesiocystis pacifica SIR-1]
MTTTAAGWTIIDEDAGVLSLPYTYGKDGKSNCFAAKLPSGGVLLVSPPSRVSDEAVAELEAIGPIEAIVANNGFHYLGVDRWQKRFPKARSYAAPGAIARIAKRSTKPLSFEPLSALAGSLGDDVAVVEAPGSRHGETWVRAKIADGYAWYASDILTNLAALPKPFLPRTLFKLTKSGPGYSVFNLAVRFIFKDKGAGLGAMIREVGEYPPTVMVPAHGDILRGADLAEKTRGLLQAAL